MTPSVTSSWKARRTVCRPSPVAVTISASVGSRCPAGYRPAAIAWRRSDATWRYAVTSPDPSGTARSEVRTALASTRWLLPRSLTVRLDGHIATVEGPRQGGGQYRPTPRTGGQASEQPHLDTVDVRGLTGSAGRFGRSNRPRPPEPVNGQEWRCGDGAARDVRARRPGGYRPPGALRAGAGPAAAGGLCRRGDRRCHRRLGPAGEKRAAGRIGRAAPPPGDRAVSGAAGS